MENLLLLHGALGAASAMAPLAQALGEQFQVYVLDFTGHGGKPLPQEPFSMQLFVQDIFLLLEENGISSAHIFGYSMGGYAALCLAQQQPQRVKSIFTLATKFAWSPEAAAKETKLLDPEKIEEKVPAFATTLATRHHPQDWKQVMHKTAQMMLQLGEKPVLIADVLQQIQVPVQLTVGDQDNMVTVEETLWAYRQLPVARLQVLPATRHSLETISVDKLSQEIRQFINSLTVQYKIPD